MSSSNTGFAEFIARLPEDNKAKGTRFEEFCVENLPLQPGLDIAEAWLWEDWEHRWGADLGIDFVVLDRSGNYWAGQSKALKKGSLVKKGEIDSFLNESAGKIPTLGVHFARRLIVTTGNGLGRNTSAAVRRRTEIPTTVITYDSLEDWVIKGSIETPMAPRFEPRKHQLKAIKKTVKGFDSSDKGQLIMACGTGKTLTALWICEELSPNLTVVALPSLSLMRQTLEIWSQQARKEFKAISICSDDSVAPGEDLLITSVLDLELPVTTNLESLKTEINTTRPKVIFTTYASFPVLCDLLQAASLIPDLTIADEAHRTVGQQGSRSTLIHDKTRFISHKTLFMTATPRVIKAPKGDRETEADFASMDNPELFGPVFHSLSFFQAIHEEHILSEYEVHGLLVKDPKLFLDLGIGTRARGSSSEELRSIFDLLIPAVLAKFAKKNSLRSIITYHSRKDRAQSFKDALNANLDSGIRAFFVSGEMTAKNRARVLDNFDDDGAATTVVSNARCLTEGIDVPALDAVAFIDPRYSVTDIVQAIGRVLRSAPGKTKGHVLVPMIANEAGEISQESYLGIWRVIKALESHDPSLTDEIEAVSREVGAGRVPRGLSILKIESLGEFSAEFIDKVTSQVVSQTLSSWGMSLGNLIEFIKQHDRQPQRNEEFRGRLPEGFRNTLRTHYKAGLLSAIRIGQVEKAFAESFGSDFWSWDSQLAQDLEAVDHLEEFVRSKLKKEYSPFVKINRKPGKSLCKHGFDVGLWALSLQTRARRTGLSDELQTRLLKVPNYTTEDKNRAIFEWARERYVEYFEEHGWSPMTDYRTGTYGSGALLGYPLGQTVSNWRATKKRGSMPKWKIDALNEVGFHWEVVLGARPNKKRLPDSEWWARYREADELCKVLKRLPTKHEGRFKKPPNGLIRPWIDLQIASISLDKDQQIAIGKLPQGSRKRRSPKYS